MAEKEQHSFVSRRDKDDGGKWVVSPVVDDKSPDEIEDRGEFDTKKEAVDFAKSLAEKHGGSVTVENRTTGEIKTTRYKKN